MNRHLEYFCFVSFAIAVLQWLFLYLTVCVYISLWEMCFRSWIHTVTVPDTLEDAWPLKFSLDYFKGLKTLRAFAHFYCPDFLFTLLSLSWADVCFSVSFLSTPACHLSKFNSKRKSALIPVIFWSNFLVLIFPYVVGSFWWWVS